MTGSCYFPADVHFYPAGPDSVFAQSRNDGSVTVVPRTEGELFHMLYGCQPLEAHCATVAAGLGRYPDDEIVVRLINSWKESQLLRPASLLNTSFQMKAVKRTTGTKKVSFFKELTGKILSMAGSGEFLFEMFESFLSGSSGQRNLELLVNGGGEAEAGQMRAPAVFNRGRILPGFGTGHYGALFDSRELHVASEGLEAILDSVLSGKELLENSDLCELPPAAALYMEQGSLRIGAVIAGYRQDVSHCSKHQIALARFNSEEEFFTSAFSGESPAQFVSSPEAPEILHGNIPPGHSLLAVDPSLCLPPFFEGCISSDYSLLILSGGIYPNMAVLQMPVMTGETVTADSSSLVSRDILEGLIAAHVSQRLLSDTVSTRFAEAGRLYCELSMYSTSGFLEFISSLKRMYAQQQAERAAHLLNIYGGKPDPWAESLSCYIDRCRNLVEDPSSDIIAVSSETLGEYGKVLRHWEDLRNRILSVQQS